MRIHSLEIQAFGPFAGREVVDFDALGAHGLFLLNGPTGAGKTSILDAVCYAFYGSVPGARQEGRRLRSDHADAGTAPEVVCEFSVRGRRWKIIRSPQWVRPSKRGTGTTTEQAHTLLSEWMDGAWVEKSARNDEAASEIQDLLGMTREQFTRVVMLPQGDFAAFLRSDAKSRRDLLQQLFNTDRFERIEQQLAEEAALARSAWDGRRSELERTHQRILEVWAAHTVPDPLNQHADEPSVDSTDAADREPPPPVPEVREQLRSVASAAVAEVEFSRSRMESARSAAAEAEAMSERGEALGEYRRRQEAWESGESGAREIAESLEVHRKADTLTSVIRRAEEAGRTADAREQETEARRAVLGRHPLWTAPGCEGRDITEEVLKRESRAAGTTLGTIDASLPDEHRLRGLAEEQHLLKLSVRDDEQRQVRLLKELEILQGTRSELLRQELELLPVVNDSPSAEQALESAERQQEAVSRYADQRRLGEEIQAEHTRAREAALDRKAACLDLMQTRLGQAAAELASRLSQGQPCPVCGSTSHPHTADAGDDGLVSREDEQRARAAQESAEAELESVAAKLAQVREELSALAAHGGDQPGEAVAQAVASAADRVNAARTAAVELADIQSRISEVSEQIQHSEELQASLKETIGQAKVRTGHLGHDITDLEGRLLELRAGHNSLDDRRRSIAQYRDQLDAVREADGLARASREAAEDAQAHLTEELRRAGFASAAEAQGARLEPSAATAFETRAAARLRERVELDALGDSALIRAARADEGSGTVAPDQEALQELRQEAQQAEEKHTQARVRSGILAGAVEQVEGYAARFEDLERDAAPLRERWELLGQLAETARGSGDNAYRMTLGTYVLAARLEQVAAAATERLATMTDGRYALVHSDAKSGNRKSGLALHVTDEWTGQSRDTATLSGGESFMASLALALGLADVVQQESGGVEMETLFVDEGFGSLDEQSLEQVMDALEGLRDGGRIVGLVSHVAEMKQRIPAQLQVVKERTGSSIRFRELTP